MKYYALPKAFLTDHGIGDESWRKKNRELVLVSEAEVSIILGFDNTEDFENATGAIPLSIDEAKKWECK